MMLQRNEKQLVTRYAAAWTQALASRPSACRADLQSLQKLLAEVPAFAQLVGDRLIAPRDRVRMLQALFPQLGLDAITQAWLLQLARRRRLALLPACLGEALGQLSQADGRQQARVTSAHPIGDGHREKIAQALMRWMNLPQKPEIAWSVDPQLLSGFRCLIGSFLLDFSGDTKLKTMARSLIEGHELSKL
ncbi:MAG: hypothetical protein FJX22_00260 [Alphaproteobacteria bacterium]|nr:hypothetical protein [Alphaproteobacteria bacterium]